MGSPILTTSRFSELVAQMEYTLRRHHECHETLPSPRVRYHDLEALARQFQPRFEATARIANELGQLQNRFQQLFRQFNQDFQNLCNTNTALKTELSGRAAEVAVSEALVQLQWRGVVTSFFYAEPGSDPDREGVDFIIMLPDVPPLPLQVKSSESRGQPFRAEQETLRAAVYDDPVLYPIVPIEVIVTNSVKEGHFVPKPRRILMKELRRIFNRWRLHLQRIEEIVVPADQAFGA